MRLDPSTRHVRWSPRRPMPRTFQQGLYFMLGFLLAFYVLLPFLGVRV